MSDDLVKRLRQWGKWVLEDRPGSLVTLVTDEAADRIEQLEAALRSIAANSCCDTCQEAALVARSALGEKEND